MSASDNGLGFIIMLSVILGVIWGELKTRTKPKPINDKIEHRTKRKIEEDLSLEDSEGDGLFFDEPLFPPEFPEFDENN
jgi:hypothetical protein